MSDGVKPRRGRGSQRNGAKAIWLALLALGVFGLTSYGGVRSPDSEVVYRTARALALDGSFAVEERLEAWPSFGLAPGRQGSLYSVFGPLESVLLVPFVALGEAMTAGNGFEGRAVPVNHYLGKGWWFALRDERPVDAAAHAARWPAAWFNVLVGVLCLWIFSRLAWTLTRHEGVSLSVAALFGLGSPMWAYSGTFFSEPLAILLLLLSALLLIEPYEGGRAAISGWGPAVASGLFLGLAVLAHVTALFFAPFFAAYLVLSERDGRPDRSRPLSSLGAWLGGVSVGLALLGVYNYVRFGSLFETGRGVDPSLAAENGYGTFAWPGSGLAGLLFSPGKGLFLYAPVVVLGLLAWPRFHRRHRWLSWTLGSGLLFRLLVIASRSDWHGGFGLGPRLLMMAVPFLILPVGSWLAEELGRANRKRLTLFSWLAFGLVAQQLYFALGEPFEVLHYRRLAARAAGRSFDAVWGWLDSALVNSLERGVGPFLLKTIPVAPEILWLLGAALTGIAVALWRRWLIAGAGRDIRT